jgi:hypothetical protein
MTESSLHPGTGFVAKARCGSGRTHRSMNRQGRLEEAVPSRSTMISVLTVSPITHYPGDIR